jgi:alanine dehydrogenase
LINTNIDDNGIWFHFRYCFFRYDTTFRKYDVIHYCVPNIASRVARSATYALTNIFTPILLDIAEQGGLKNVIWKSAGIRSATYLYQGILTNKDIASKFEMTAKDLDLIIVTNL